MRIIGGRYARHRLSAVPKKGVRPTADPVREALFNILGDRVVDRPFFDLCAGTGSVGLEALSRGASRITFVERSRIARAVIERNLEILGPQARDMATIVAADVSKYLRTLVAPVEPAIVFLDPPYEDRRHAEWLARIGENFAIGTEIVVEHRSGASIQPASGRRAEGGNRLRSSWSRAYGDSELSAWSIETI